MPCCYVLGCGNKDKQVNGKRIFARGHFTLGARASPEMRKAWVHNIPKRADLPFNPDKHCICYKHFEEKYIVKRQRDIHFPNGDVLRGPERKRWTLTDDAIPTKFSNQLIPKYYDKRAQRKPPKSRRSSEASKAGTQTLLETKETRTAPATLENLEIQEIKPSLPLYPIVDRPKISKITTYHCCCSFCLQRFTEEGDSDNFFHVKKARLETYQEFVKVVGKYLNVDVPAQDHRPAFPGYAVSSVCLECLRSIQAIVKIYERLKSIKMTLDYEAKRLITRLKAQQYQTAVADLKNERKAKGDLIRVIQFNDVFLNAAPNLTNYPEPEIRLERMKGDKDTITTPTQPMGSETEIKIEPETDGDQADEGGGGSSNVSVIVEDDDHHEGTSRPLTPCFLVDDENDDDVEMDGRLGESASAAETSQAKLVSASKIMKVTSSATPSTSKAATSTRIRYPDGADSQEARSHSSKQVLSKTVNSPGPNSKRAASSKSTSTKTQSQTESEELDIKPEIVMNVDVPARPAAAPPLHVIYGGQRRVVCKLKNVVTGETYFGVVGQPQANSAPGAIMPAPPIKMLALKSIIRRVPRKPQPKPPRPHPRPPFVCRVLECGCGQEFPRNSRRCGHEFRRTRFYTKIARTVAENGGEELPILIPEVDGRPPYKCHKSDCDKVFQTEIDWKAHYLFHYMRSEEVRKMMVKLSTKIGKRLKLEEKQRQAREAQAALEALKRKKYRCQVCRAWFYLEKSLQCHMKMHTEFPAQCKFCEEEFPGPKQLFAHELSHLETPDTVKNKELCCPRCDRVYCSRRGLRLHYEATHLKIRRSVTHNDKNRYVCTKCEVVRNFFTPRKYINHLKSFHEEDVEAELLPFVCPVSNCAKRFRNEQWLRHHQAQHSREPLPLIKCHICKRGYALRKNYERHMRAHARQKAGGEEEKESPKKCFLCQICGKAFGLEGYLHNHHFWMHSSTGSTGIEREPKKQSYQNQKSICHLCGKAFTQAGSLKFHIKTQHK